MGQFARLIGRYDAETKAYGPAGTNAAGTAGQASYTPDFNGTLIGLRCFEGGGVAASLMNHLQWKLTNSDFKPNIIEVGYDGAGIQTAPRTTKPLNWPTTQPIKSGSAITIEARNLTADTPISVDAFLYGIFQS